MKRCNGWQVREHSYHCVIVGTGAAGMNCAKKLYEYLARQGFDHPERCIALVTAGRGLGASRMSGSDKQTYYKLGTSPDVADSACDFAESLTGGGCCHGDLALVEAANSLRGFYNLVEAGVPFPHDAAGSYIGYKTDHDPYERATSAGPRTSRFMSECLEAIVTRYGIPIFDNMEVADLLVDRSRPEVRIAGVAALDKAGLAAKERKIAVFRCTYLVLAAGGPGALYETSVYPLGQTGLHGLAVRAGLAAENLTESQFGLSSVKFRWNVSGTYMQAIPHLFSTDGRGGDERDFLVDYFPSMRKMASAIFLKGYQWPFDPARVFDFQSSFIDLLVNQETQRGRRVFLDFRENPRGGPDFGPFALADLEEEAFAYLDKAGARQRLPIERLEHMNPQAVELYREHAIDLHAEPLEIAVCAQHNNGGLAVNHWWQSNIANTFIIGEMAGTHGVKRPGGSALNAGQVGAERAAHYIAHLSGTGAAPTADPGAGRHSVQPDRLIEFLDRCEGNGAGLDPALVLAETRQRMTEAGAHLRTAEVVSRALDDAAALYRSVRQRGLRVDRPGRLVDAVQAEHLALAAIAYLHAIDDLLARGGGSRGSYLVVSDRGEIIHPELLDPAGRAPLAALPENRSLRRVVQRIRCRDADAGTFSAEMVPTRKARLRKQAFESAWKDYRRGAIYEDESGEMSG